jgi:hypothetical protein
MLADCIEADELAALITSSYMAPLSSTLVYVTDVAGGGGAGGGLFGLFDLGVPVPLSQAAKHNAKIAMSIAERNQFLFIKNSLSHDSPHNGLSHALFCCQHKPAMFLKLPLLICNIIKYSFLWVNHNAV